MTISENTTMLAKKKIGVKLILAQMDEIATRRNWDFEIQGLTKNTRDLLAALMSKILQKNDITSPLAEFYLFSGLVEVLLNALKGNIRQAVFKNEILKRLSDKDMPEETRDKLLDAMLCTTPIRDALQRYILPTKIKSNVQEILKIEEKRKTKKESLNEEENNILIKIKELIHRYDYKISMKLVITDEDFYIRIRNNVPISQKDQDRINESRNHHRELFEQGNSADFFRPENLNESESAGLGIAMVDEGYYNLGLDPIELFNVTTSSRATTIYMRYPLEVLRQITPA